MDKHKGKKLRTAKEIAEYLGCSVRTVYNYIKQQLPVYRPGRGRLMAWTGELDAWETAHPQK